MSPLPAGPHGAGPESTAAGEVQSDVAAVSAPGFLSGVAVLAAREWLATFDSAIAYVYTIAFALLANSIFMNEFFLAGRAEMTALFDLLPLLLVVFLPAITMRLWAEESQKRTLELLLTLPIRPLQAVLAKFLAACGLYAVFLATTLPIPGMLLVLGEPDLGRIAAGYLGLLCFGAAFLALGLLASSLTQDQIVAFTIATVTGFLLVLSGDERLVSVLDGLWPDRAVGTFLHDHLSALPPYQQFVRGLLDLPALLYFLGLAAAALWANTAVLAVRRG
jgi:ABC-2 type transport system permease protein